MLRFIKFLIFISISLLFSSNFFSYNGQVYIVGLNQYDSTMNYDYRLNYIPEFRKKIVINANSNIDINYSLYKDDNSQQYLGIGLGPEIIIGNYKKKLFDYTRLKIQPFYKFNSGNSIFKFDQVSDKFIINLNFDQHLIGSWLVETKGTINLDKESDHYGELINSRIGINFKKRSYSVGIFYQPNNKAGGINFNLNGFK